VLADYRGDVFSGSASRRIFAIHAVQQRVLVFPQLVDPLLEFQAVLAVLG